MVARGPAVAAGPGTYTGAVAQAVLFTTVLCMAVTLFWPGGEVRVIDAATGRIVFFEDAAPVTPALGWAWIDSDPYETVASSGADIVAGLGRNTFTVACTSRGCGIFDPLRASFALTVRDAAGRPYSESITLERAGAEILSVSFVAEEVGEGDSRIVATSIR